MPFAAAKASRWLRAAARRVDVARIEQRAHLVERPLEGSRTACRRSWSVPAWGRSRPTMHRRVVDLPAPFGPRKPVTRPGWTSNERSSTATVRPNRLVSRRTSITATDGTGSGSRLCQARRASTSQRPVFAGAPLVGPVGPERRRVELEPQVGLDGVAGPGAGDAAHELAVLEQADHRDAHDVVAGADRRAPRRR